MVRAVIPNPAGALRPGLFVTARLTVGEILVRCSFRKKLGFGQDKAMVFQVEERTVKLKEVTLGMRERGIVMFAQD